ncbi:uncharacterized protein N7483_011183 [Penicillium malachiteum]|uniref:uncharacterized protein n=1 Tax=Penicillium malachiteum TaxID=1324776 RepID=UPI0025476DA3|nr:uncharacterized protein N7483_011183 [Penicillium malachiteum]KAJ5714002.1 hypothetical protein N7483_011183 [Penicillium malachiteum]
MTKDLASMKTALKKKVKTNQKTITTKEVDRVTKTSLNNHKIPKRNTRDQPRVSSHTPQNQRHQQDALQPPQQRHPLGFRGFQNAQEDQEVHQVP